MTRELVKQAQRLYSSSLVPHRVNKHNRRAWIRSVHQLGDKWVLRGGEAKWGNLQQGEKNAMRF